MIIDFDRGTKELCGKGWLPITCPHCRRTITIDEDAVCVAKKNEVHIYHAECFSDEKESALEEVGYDVSYGKGSEFID